MGGAAPVRPDTPQHVRLLEHHPAGESEESRPQRANCGGSDALRCPLRDGSPAPATPRLAKRSSQVWPRGSIASPWITPFVRRSVPIARHRDFFLLCNGIAHFDVIIWISSSARFLRHPLTRLPSSFHPFWPSHGTRVIPNAFYFTIRKCHRADWRFHCLRGHTMGSSAALALCCRRAATQPCACCLPACRRCAL